MAVARCQRAAISLHMSERPNGLQDLHITLSAPNLNALSGALAADSALTLQLEDGTRVDGFLAGTRFVPWSGRRES